ncbi:DUF6069 family protein [Halorubrum sp. AJ67]|uniref:DUF6069 family protein n=1 Tax=Halorubrum sp. AJ67 TaxID=1173487 RepID=UPI00064E1BA1|nr:DUF6069 family protein [Halorubrum sp. AJ67]
MSIENYRPIDTQTLIARGVVALAIALIVNLVLGWVALTQNLVASTEFFQYPPIVVWTLLGMVGATVVYRVLTQRSTAPDRIFVRIAAIVLVLSFIPDLGLALFTDSVTLSEAIGLMSLHVPPAIVTVLALPETPLGR